MGAIGLLEPRHGPLVIVGGAEDKTGACSILRELVRLAGGTSARIAVVTVASEYPRRVGATYVEVLTRLGAGYVEPVDVRVRGEADHPAVLQAIEDATAVYFSGGNQARIADLVGGTAFEATLHRRWRTGLVVGGTSAGAAAMSWVMILGSPGPRGAARDAVVLGRGLGFVPGVIVDQHFSERQRLGRLLAAVRQHPDTLGLGIDEDTAVVLHGDVGEVHGCGTVTLAERHAVGDPNTPNGRHVDGDVGTGYLLHSLTAGQRFTPRRQSPAGLPIVAARPGISLTSAGSAPRDGHPT